MIPLLPPGARIFVACDPVDGRKSFDSLAALVKSILKKEPMEGSIFVFRNKTGHRVRCLAWDRTGWMMLLKRLESGIFRFPSSDGASVEIDAAQLRMLLDGIELGFHAPEKRPEARGA
jgi:transposase